MEAVILKTVSIGTIDYTSGIMKDRVENFCNIFDNYETRSRYPLWVNGNSHVHQLQNLLNLCGITNFTIDLL